MEDGPTISFQYTIPARVPRIERERILDAYIRLITVISAADGRPSDDATARQPAVRTTPTLTDWDRGRVLQQIEEASRHPISVDDSLPDSLIATAQGLGLKPHELGVWIYDSGHQWQATQLATWAKRNGFGTSEPPTLIE